MASWFRLEGELALVSVKAIPGARETAVAGLRGDALAVRVAAPPEKGKANAELERGLAKLLGLSRTQVRLVSGPSSRSKLLAIPTSALGALAALAGADSRDPGLG